MRVTFYTTERGRSPIVEYLRGLSKPTRARVLEALQQVEVDGFDAVRVRFRSITGKLWEMKVDDQRLLYVFASTRELVVLHAYRKQSQKLPLKDREIALQRMHEVLK